MGNSFMDAMVLLDKTISIQLCFFNVPKTLKVLHGTMPHKVVEKKFCPRGDRYFNPFR